jgi:hypothetical protein
VKNNKEAHNGGLMIKLTILKDIKDKSFDLIEYKLC